MRFLLILFVAVPVVEIYFLITVGSAIGVGMTIALILLTAFIGAFLVRSQGFSTMNSVQMQLAKGEMPAIEMFEGLFLVVAGALLLTPGFVTDAIGFACLTPPLRRWLISKMLAKGVLGQVASPRGFTEQRRPEESPNRVIDGEFRDLDD